MTDAVDVKIADLPAAGAVEPGAMLPLVRDMGAAGLITQRATAAQIVESTLPKAHTHAKAEVDLGNVDNTSDASKPVSTAQRAAIDDKMAAHLADAAHPHITLAQAAGAAPVQSVAGRTGNVTLTSADVGLGNVANLPPDDLPLSAAATAALGGKMDVGASISTSQVTGLSAAIAAGVTSGAVTAVNGHTGNVTLSKADVGLDRVANLTPDALPVSTATATALSAKLDASAVGVSVASLVAGKVPASQLPDPAAGRKVTVANQAARLALDPWDDLTIAYQVDTQATWGLNANDDPSAPANWSLMGSFAASGVASFNGRTGPVEPQTGDYTAAQVGADPAGAAAAAVADHRADPNAHVGYVKTTDLTKAAVGLDRADNTSDASKPVSTATATALAAKVDAADARFTGQVRERLNPLGNVTGAATVDLAAGGYVTATATGACTWAFVGGAAPGFATAFTLQLTNGGTGVQTFPATPMGAAPTLQAAGTDVLVFVHDGAAWRYAKVGA